MREEITISLIGRAPVKVSVPKLVAMPPYLTTVNLLPTSVAVVESDGAEGPETLLTTREIVSGTAGVRVSLVRRSLFGSNVDRVLRQASQAVTTDCKEYVEAGRTFSVAQIEEIGFDQFHKRKVLERLRKGLTGMTVTDIRFRAGSWCAGPQPEGCGCRHPA